MNWWAVGHLAGGCNAWAGSVWFWLECVKRRGARVVGSYLSGCIFSVLAPIVFMFPSITPLHDPV